MCFEGLQRIKTNNVGGGYSIERVQFPIAEAEAFTIHKAQGSTLDIAEVDAGSGIFECGQTYVALSRVKSLEGLYLCSFDAKRVRINKKVQQFYELLEEACAKEEALANKAEINSKDFFMFFVLVY